MSKGKAAKLSEDERLGKALVRVGFQITLDAVQEMQSPTCQKVAHRLQRLWDARPTDERFHEFYNTFVGLCRHGTWPLSTRLDRAKMQRFVETETEEAVVPVFCTDTQVLVFHEDDNSLIVSKWTDALPA